jgi:hypothetical protein
MAFTYSKLAEVTLASSAATINFTNIPQNYTDLVLRLSGRINTAAYTDDILLSLNSNTSSFTWRSLYYYGGGAAGSNTSSTSPGNGQILGGQPGTTTTSNTFGNMEIYFPNYAGSRNKSISTDSVNENNAADNFMSLTANLWANTTAINQITLTPRSASFVQHSTAYLYGVKAEV